MLTDLTAHCDYLNEKNFLALPLAEFLLKRVCSRVLLEGRLVRSPMAA
jgi:hypothetical protein